MKIWKLARLSAMVVCLSVVGGCDRTNTFPGTPSYSTTSAAPTSTGRGATATHTALSDPTLSPTLAAIPTLSQEDARLELANLLSKNGGCRLPCLWGITPGESTLQDAQRVLTPLSGISGFSALGANSGVIHPMYEEGDRRIVTSVSFLFDPDSNIVTSISFDAKALREISQGNSEDLFGDPHYNQLLKTYSLEQILTTYGPPADILVRTNSSLPLPPQPWGPFELLLSYPEMGVLVHYTMPMKPEGPTIVGCPEESRLNLDLEPSGKFASTAELLAFEAAPAKVEDIFPGFRPIEEVTSLSPNKFVKVFSLPTEECIETPAASWPEP